MKLWRLIKPKTGKEIPFLILTSFLLTFALSRLVTMIIPGVSLKVRSVHVHHFAYGFALLVMICYYLLTQPRSPRTRIKVAILYGIALGLAFDEFAMWIQLEDDYYDRSSYDAMVITTTLLLNIVYFDNFWKKWGYRLGKLAKRIFS